MAERDRIAHDALKCLEQDSTLDIRAVGRVAWLWSYGHLDDILSQLEDDQIEDWMLGRTVHEAIDPGLTRRTIIERKHKEHELEYPENNVYIGVS